MTVISRLRAGRRDHLQRLGQAVQQTLPSKGFPTGGAKYLVTLLTIQTEPLIAHRHTPSSCRPSAMGGPTNPEMTRGYGDVVNVRRPLRHVPTGFLDHGRHPTPLHRHNRRSNAHRRNPCHLA